MQSTKSPTGIVFNMQKFSLHDGPGIRTVVFLKGCPLHCLWCANPESQLPRIEILHDKTKCRQCLHCVDVCPQKAISIDNHTFQLLEEKCNGCGKCVKECPAKALSQEGETKTIDEVLHYCLQDLDFYEESGGGVTLSGGEVLRSHEFAAALLKVFKENKLHTAIETSGFAAPDTFNKITKYADLLLFDLKHWDSIAHKKGTGVSNELPLSNMKAAITAGKAVLPRIPVIPGFNDSLEDAAGFAAALHKVGAARAQLLPFHQFGENKYKLLGKKYVYDNTPPLRQEDLLEFQERLRRAGIDAFF